MSDGQGFAARARALLKAHGWILPAPVRELIDEMAGELDALRERIETIEGKK